MSLTFSLHYEKLRFEFLHVNKLPYCKVKQIRTVLKREKNICGGKKASEVMRQGWHLVTATRSALVVYRMASRADANENDQQTQKEREKHRK